MKKVVVVGSINMDLVTMCQRVPEAGETIFGEKFFQVPGGKGANQGVAIGKLGTEVTMLGKVGNDSFGNDLINSMKNSGVNTEYIEKSESSTGIAKIIVEGNGQNRILVVSGANMDVDKDYIDRHIDVIKNADIVVTQLELPLSTVEYALEKAKEFGKITILNPAPAAPLSEKMIKSSDIIIPNETELSMITKMATDTEDEIKAACKKLLDMGVKEKSEFHSAYIVKAVDTTAAGDSFIGGFVKALNGNNIDEAIEFGTKVSAIAVTRLGAQSSIPTLEEVNEFQEVKR